MVTFQSLRHMTRIQSLMEAQRNERNMLGNRHALTTPMLNSTNQNPFDVRPNNQTEHALRHTVARAQTMLSVADEGLHHIGGVLHRMQTIAKESSLDTTSESGRAMLQTEFMHLRDHITNIAKSTRFEDMALLNGTNNVITLNVRDKTGEQFSYQAPDARRDAFFERSTMSVRTPQEAEQADADITKALHLLTEKQNYITQRRTSINFTPTELNRNLVTRNTAPPTINGGRFPQLPSEFAQLFHQWNPTEMIQAQTGRTQQEPWQQFLMSSLFGR